MASKVNLNIDLTAIPNMAFRDMYALYIELFHIPNKSTRKEFYIWRISNRLQELRFGGLDAKTRQILETMDINSLPEPKHHLPVGTEVVKKFKGATYRLRILKDGFELDGKIYKSLSAVVLDITGRKISGQEFFGV